MGYFKSLACGIAALLWWLVSVTSASGAILDQFQEEWNGGTHIMATHHVAQTFTPSISGALDHVDVRIDLVDPAPLQISIAEVAGGVPTDQLLGSVEVLGPPYGWNSISFLSEAVFLTSGTQYAIILSNDDPDPVPDTTAWAVKWTGDPYGAGSLWDRYSGGPWQPHYYEDADATFRTYMVPEPTAAWLLSFALLLVSGRRL